ncbi:MAG: hypothetical protein ABIJ16_13340 [Bacteroidota bacterium]
MSTLLRREFMEEYGVDLLPYSTGNLSLGEICDWKGLIHQVIDFRHYTLADYFPWDEKDIKRINRELSEIKMSNAVFPDMEIKNEFESSSDMVIPGTNISLENKVDTNAVKSFRFINVKAKVLEGEVRRKLAAGLEVLKEKDFNLYKEKIRKFWIIESLFYAKDVEISVEKSVSIDLIAELSSTGLENLKVDHKSGSGKVHSYVIKGLNCPFAGELVKGRKF